MNEVEQAVPSHSPQVANFKDATFRTQKDNMTDKIPERDGKYMRSIHDEIMAALCAKINRQSEIILEQGRATPRKTYRDLYRHLEISTKL